jgi:hypothetical protein
MKIIMDYSRLLRRLNNKQRKGKLKRNTKRKTPWKIATVIYMANYMYLTTICDMKNKGRKHLSVVVNTSVKESETKKRLRLLYIRMISNSLRVKNSLFSTSSIPALGPAQPPIQWEPGALSPGVKRLWRETDHSPPTSANVKKT